MYRISLGCITEIIISRTLRIGMMAAHYFMGGSPSNNTHQEVKSSVPYLIGGLVAVRGLVSVALLMLVCSLCKQSNDQHEGIKIKNSELCREHTEANVMVIMGGDERPAFLFDNFLQNWPQGNCLAAYQAAKQSWVFKILHLANAPSTVVKELLLPEILHLVEAEAPWNLHVLLRSVCIPGLSYHREKQDDVYVMSRKNVNKIIQILHTPKPKLVNQIYTWTNGWDNPQLSRKNTFRKLKDNTLGVVWHRLKK